ncbi:MAG: insulinase family protein [Saprospiraceae bacterium]|nr:insulinase family protein [Candidatus Vicinibacter affinis]
MINQVIERALPYHRTHLANGLTLIVVPDQTTMMACVCILYRVGSRDEKENKTGLAHLFEHLMFSNCGKEVDFDEIMQNAGGESNAFTTPDTTQYYNIAPSSQLELMLQLEAHRMNGFKIKRKEFEIQQRVVIEEFSEHYLNNPYGLFSHYLMAMSYEVHPYKWPVIGRNQEEIAGLEFKDADEFYHTYYNPSNAVLVVTGNVNPKEVEQMVARHFGDISSGVRNQNKYAQEPPQNQKRIRTVPGEYPEEALYIGMHASARNTKEFYALDFLTDILSEGRSSLLYSKLRKEKMLFSNIDCYLSSTTDPGIILLEGKLRNGVKVSDGEAAFWEIIEQLKSHELSDHDWQKYMNKNESAYLFSQVGVVNQALNYSYAEWLGDINLVLNELEHYRSLTKEDLQAALLKYFNADQANYLYLTNSQ